MYCYTKWINTSTLPLYRPDRGQGRYVGSAMPCSKTNWNRSPLIDRTPRKRCCSIRRYRTIIHGRPKGFAGKLYICYFCIVRLIQRQKKPSTRNLQVDSTTHCKQRGIWCAVTMIWRLQGYAMSLRGSQTTTVTTIQTVQGDAMSLHGSQTTTHCVEDNHPRLAEVKLWPFYNTPLGPTVRHTWLPTHLCVGAHFFNLWKAHI